MHDEQLLRYSRQIMLPQVDIQGQTRLLGARVLVLGLGGLGSPVALYLAAAGVGELILNDFDRVDLSNLQRQILHTSDRIGTPKTQSAATALKALNPDCRIELVEERLAAGRLQALVDRVDLVVDGTDNFGSRFLINDACVRTGTPLVSGAAIRFEGQVTVFRNDRDDSPCYRCLYPETEELAETCSENGVFTPLVGAIGSVQAIEAMKVLLGIGQDLSGRLLLLDALNMEWRTLRLRKDPACSTCG